MAITPLWTPASSEGNPVKTCLAMTHGWNRHPRLCSGKEIDMSNGYRLKYTYFYMVDIFLMYIIIYTHHIFEYCIAAPQPFEVISPHPGLTCTERTSSFQTWTLGSKAVSDILGWIKSIKHSWYWMTPVLPMFLNVYFVLARACNVI